MSSIPGSMLRGLPLCSPHQPRRASRRGRLSLLPYAAPAAASFQSAAPEQRQRGEQAREVQGGGESRFWEWRKNIVVHYTASGPLHDRQKPSVLLLPGFGVGTFHWEHQLRAEEGGLAKDHRVWAIDFLGQGQSWPSTDPAPLTTPNNPASPPMDSSREGSVPFLTTSTSTSIPSSSSSGEPICESDAATISAAASVAAVLEEGGEPFSEVWGFGDTAHDWAQELVYSADTWKRQVEDFISEVIGEPVYLVGNSLGGYVGAYVAAERPDLVRGLALLNATPFWAFSPHPQRAPWLARLWPWTGVMPAPKIVRAILHSWWDTLRSPDTIRFLLRLVYAQKDAVDDRLVASIVEPTSHPGAASAFASIVFAPKALRSFDDNLKKLKEQGLDVCMVYGREDPWVVPMWGYRLKRFLPTALYYELSPCGHCPHHEAPEVVNQVLRQWLCYASSPTPVAPPLVLPTLEDAQAQGQGKEGEKGESRSQGSFLTSDWHVLTSSGKFVSLKELDWAQDAHDIGEDVGDLSEEATKVGGVEGGDVVKVRLVYAPPSTPVSFFQAAFDTVSSTWTRSR